MGVLDSTYKTAVDLALLPARTAVAAAEGAAELERRGRRELAIAADRALMAAVDLAVERLLSDEVIDRVLLQLEAGGVAQRVTERLLDDGTVEEVAQRVLAGPEAERMLASALEGPLVEQAISRLLENQAVWVLVDEIARSPSVTEAIAHQGTGFADQVAERARERSRKADMLLERVARRLVRRGDSDREGPRPSLPEGTGT